MSVQTQHLGTGNYGGNENTPLQRNVPRGRYSLYRVVSGFCRFVKLGTYTNRADAESDREWFVTKYQTDQLIIVES